MFRIEAFEVEGCRGGVAKGSVSPVMRCYGPCINSEVAVTKDTNFEPLLRGTRCWWRRVSPADVAMVYVSPAKRC